MSATTPNSWELLESSSQAAFHRKVTVLSAAGTFLDGYDLAVIAVALPVLKKEWHLAASVEAPLAASAVIGMLIGALVVGRLTDKLGRKAMYLIDLLGFVVFAVLTAAAQDVWQLMVFRFLLGLALGADYPISSTLLAEYAPAARRGAMMCRMGAAWFAGSAAAYLVGAALTPLGGLGWRLMLLLGAVFALVVIWLRRSVPESPRWLRSRGRGADAAEVLTYLEGDHAGTVAAAPVLSKAGGGPDVRPWRILFSRPVLRWTVFCCGFWAVYTMAYYGITIYTPTILATLTTTAWQASVGSAAVGLIGLVGSGIGILLVDRVGRRPLIIAAFAGLTLSLLVLAVIGSAGLVVVAVLLAVAVMCANGGPGILDFLYPTELLPTEVRATGTGLATGVSRIGGILGIVLFPGLVSAWGLSHAMWLFVACGVVGTAICVMMAPETKGKTLEELNDSLLPGYPPIGVSPDRG
ncbi:MFS transporter [Pseudonocardia spinosispora]|uniref:MFS transporter n=1 Tax=Pseudonocardia spinosispora TaxID=103441 RepID=UPI00042A5653|nr:MFS transporter [Pseudonocardia spinosispora]